MYNTKAVRDDRDSGNQSANIDFPNLRISRWKWTRCLEAHRRV